MNEKINFKIAKLLDDKNYPFVFTTVGDVERVPLNIPTIAEVVMWLYEKHKIWIYVDGDCRPHIIKDNVDLNHKGEVNRIVLLDGKTKVQYCWDSPTEAYESAINYTLENLI